jgi:hypothetical protein
LDEKTSGTRRERLQMTTSGFSFHMCSMNAFPIPEEPPVTMMTEYSDSISRSVRMGMIAQASHPFWPR